MPGGSGPPWFVVLVGLMPLYSCPGAFALGRTPHAPGAHTLGRTPLGAPALCRMAHATWGSCPCIYALGLTPPGLCCAEYFFSGGDA